MVMPDWQEEKGSNFLQFPHPAWAPGQKFEFIWGIKENKRKART